MQPSFQDLLDALDGMTPKRGQDFLGRTEDGEGPKVVMNPDPSWEPAELAAGIIDT